MVVVVVLHVLCRQRPFRHELQDPARMINRYVNNKAQRNAQISRQQDPKHYPIVEPLMGLLFRFARRGFQAQ